MEASRPLNPGVLVRAQPQLQIRLAGSPETTYDDLIQMVECYSEKVEMIVRVYRSSLIGS